MTDFQEVNGYRVVRELGKGAIEPPAATAAAWGLKAGDVISGVERYGPCDSRGRPMFGNIVFLKVRHIGLKCVLWEAHLFRIQAAGVEDKPWNTDAETASYTLFGRSWRLMERIPKPKVEQAEPVKPAKPAKDRVIHTRSMGVKVTIRENDDVELEDSKGATELYAPDGSCKTTFRHVSRDSHTTVTTRLWSSSGEPLGMKKLCIDGKNGDTVETWFDQDDKQVKDVVTIGDTVTTTTVERIKKQEDR